MFFFFIRKDEASWKYISLISRKYLVPSEKAVRQRESRLAKQDLEVKEKKPAADIDSLIDKRYSIECLFSFLKYRSSLENNAHVSASV